MSVEMRRIVFSRDEVISAVLTFCHAKSMALPASDVEDVEIGSGFAPSVTLRFRVGHPMEEDRVALTDRQTIDALTAWCRRHEIPVPPQTAMQLRGVDGELTLFCRIEHTPRCRMAAAFA